MVEELAPGPAVITSDAAMADYVRQSGVSNQHPTSSCAMGHGSNTVVDPRLRVHGIGGLRVADASIMPVAVGGNTNAPTIMIGEKCAAMILEDGGDAGACSGVTCRRIGTVPPARCHCEERSDEAISRMTSRCRSPDKGLLFVAVLLAMTAVGKVAGGGGGPATASKGKPCLRQTTPTTTSSPAPARPAACWPTRLSESGNHRVLLLEAGGKDSNPWIHIPLGYARTFCNPAVNWMFDSEPEPNLNNRVMYQPRGKVLGGTSSINGMIYMRGNHADYDHWRQLGCEGWDWESVLPVFPQGREQRTRRQGIPRRRRPAARV